MVARYPDMAAEPEEESIFTEVARRRQRSERLRALAPEEPSADAPASEPAGGGEAAELASGFGDFVIPADPGSEEVSLEEEAIETAAAEAPKQVELEANFEEQAVAASPDAPQPEPASGAFSEEADAAEEAPLFDVSDLDSADEDETLNFEKIPADVVEKSTPTEAPDVTEFSDLPLPETVRPAPRAKPESEPVAPEPVEEEPIAAEAPAAPESSAERADSEEAPEAFVEASDIVSNDLSQPESPTPSGAAAANEVEAEDPEVEELHEKTLESLVPPDERERLVEKYAPVVDLQRLPKSKPNRVLQKSKRLSEEAAKPAEAKAKPATDEDNPSQPHPESQDSKPALKKKKKRVTLLDSYFKGL